jgi:hypothetical protein
MQLRFSIRGLLIATAFVAAGCASIMTPNTVLSSLLFLGANALVAGHALFMALFAMLGGRVGGRFAAPDVTQNSEKMLT